jgi:hypothetical protein
MTEVSQSTFLGAGSTTLLLAALSWGCATTPEPDSTVQPDIGVSLGSPDAKEATVQQAIRSELDQLILSTYRTTVGWPRGAVACVEDPGHEDCAQWRAFAGALLGMADRMPKNRFVQGQVVFSMVRGQAHDLAQMVVEGCEVSDWWCQVLQAFVLAESGRVVEAEAVFDEALLLMPEQDLCDWTDLSPLVSRDSWSAYEGSSCLERLDRVEEFWWLADPAWAVPGNDRKAEHYNRMAWAALHDDLLTWRSGEGHVNDGRGHTEEHHVVVVRFGMDFYRYDARWGEVCGWPLVFSCIPCGDDVDCIHRARENGWTVCWGADHTWAGCPYRPDAQTYRVIPEEKALLEPFHASADDWPFDHGGSEENYVPQFGTLVSLEAQVAFFERGDSLAAAAAMEVPAGRAFRESPPDRAFLFLGTDPGMSPVTAEASAKDDRWVFSVMAPLQRYIVGIETVVPEAVGRFRSGHGLPHDPTAPLRLSDLLLFTPDDSPAPDSLEAAVPLMKGGQRWSQGEVMGVFLEVYGPDDAASFPVSVELERERGGLARLGEALGIGGDKPVNVQWVESAAGGRFSLSFTVDLEEVSEGDYTLRVSVVGPGMSPATVEKSIRIVEGRE